ALYSVDHDLAILRRFVPQEPAVDKCKRPRRWLKHCSIAHLELEARVFDSPDEQRIRRTTASQDYDVRPHHFGPTTENREVKVDVRVGLTVPDRPDATDLLDLSEVPN